MMASSAPDPTPTYSEEFKRVILVMLRDREGTPEHERWFRMAMERVESQRRYFIPSLERFTTCDGKKVLEVGCGTGPSSVAMAERGAQVVAIDIDPRMAEAARLRARDHHLDGRIEAKWVPDSSRLNFPDRSFDLIVCNGVLEHAAPQARGPLLREMWRVLRPGGHLFIGETPNRLFPKDMHTTQLWWQHYMPRGLAARYAKLRHRIQPADDLDAMGGMGCAFPQLMRALPRAEAHVLNLEPEFSWLGRQRAVRRGPLKRVVLACAAVAERFLLRPILRLPLDALAPFLTICVEKLENLPL
jgi:ubiquinone/menaquinone biosynthesis C-methylase UbiE